MPGKKFMALVSLGVFMMSASAALAGTKVQMNLVPSSTANPPTNPTMSRTKGKFLLTDSGSLQVSLSGVTHPDGTLVTTGTVFNTEVKAGALRCLGATGPVNGSTCTSSGTECTTAGGTCTTWLDGTEYAVVVVLDVPILPIVLSGFCGTECPETLQVVIPVDLVAGSGKTKLNLSGLMSLWPAKVCSGGDHNGAACTSDTMCQGTVNGTCIANPLGKSIGIVGVEVWGPIDVPSGDGAACASATIFPPAIAVLTTSTLRTACTSDHGGVKIGIGGINLPDPK